MKRNKKNKHDLKQLDGNSSMCEEEIETPSLRCTFCGDNFESKIKTTMAEILMSKEFKSSQHNATG